MMMILSTTAMPNLKGGYIPKYKPRINSYKLTNEGYALLNLVERVKGAASGSGQSNNKSAEKEEEQEQPQQRQQRQQEREQEQPQRSRR